MWDYRVIRKTTEKGITSAGDGDARLSVQEVYYDEETEKPMAHTVDLEVVGDNIADLRKTLQRMLWCLDKEVVDEIESDVAKDNIEDRVSSLEIENAEMKDRLKELGDEVVEKGL